MLFSLNDKWLINCWIKGLKCPSKCVISFAPFLTHSPSGLYFALFVLWELCLFISKRTFTYSNIQNSGRVFQLMFNSSTVSLGRAQKSIYDFALGLSFNVWFLWISTVELKKRNKRWTKRLEIKSRILKN